jgi:hypothetical protein
LPVVQRAHREERRLPAHVVRRARRLAEAREDRRGLRAGVPLDLRGALHERRALLALDVEVILTPPCIFH